MPFARVARRHTASPRGVLEPTFLVSVGLSIMEGFERRVLCSVAWYPPGSDLPAHHGAGRGGAFGFGCACVACNWLCRCCLQLGGSSDVQICFWRVTTTHLLTPQFTPAAPPIDASCRAAPHIPTSPLLPYSQTLAEQFPGVSCGQRGVCT